MKKHNRKKIKDEGFFLGFESAEKKKAKKKRRIIRKREKCRICNSRVSIYHHALCDKCWELENGK